jgi:hypothetical protein
MHIGVVSIVRALTVVLNDDYGHKAVPRCHAAIQPQDARPAATICRGLTAIDQLPKA